MTDETKMTLEQVLEDMKRCVSVAYVTETLFDKWKCTIDAAMDGAHERVCHALCQSRKFETGQGTCALACMGKLGDARKGGCPQATRVHSDLAAAVLAAQGQDHE